MKETDDRMPGEIICVPRAFPRVLCHEGVRAGRAVGSLTVAGRYVACAVVFLVDDEDAVAVGGLGCVGCGIVGFRLTKSWVRLGPSA